MNKVYVIVPLIGLAVFGAVYWKYHRDYEAKLAEKKRQEQLAKQQRRCDEAAARAQAIEAAKLAVEVRKQERLAREQREAEQKQQRRDAEQRRLQAFDEEKKLRARLERMRADIAAAQAAFGRVEERKRELAQEQEFLASYLPQIEANRNASYQLLEKLELVESTGGATPARPRFNPKSNG